jgi:hypothetical protein
MPCRMPSGWRCRGRGRAPFALSSVLVVVSTGCASQSTKAQAPAVTSKTPSAAAVMWPGRGRLTIRGVRVDWRRLPNGRVCYDTTRPGHEHPGGGGPLSACVRHLRADEIAFVIKPRGTGQLMIAGLKGPRVRRVYLRLLTRGSWEPPSNGSAFFGYVPRGEVAAVGKITSDGRRREFAIHAYSK